MSDPCAQFVQYAEAHQAKWIANLAEAVAERVAAAIDAGDYEAYRDEFLGRYYAGN